MWCGTYNIPYQICLFHPVSHIFNLFTREHHGRGGLLFTSVFLKSVSFTSVPKFGSTSNADVIQSANSLEGLSINATTQNTRSRKIFFRLVPPLQKNTMMWHIEMFIDAITTTFNIPYRKEKRGIKASTNVRYDTIRYDNTLTINTTTITTNIQNEDNQLRSNHGTRGPIQRLCSFLHILFLHPEAAAASSWKTKPSFHFFFYKRKNFFFIEHEPIWSIRKSCQGECK